MSAIEALQFWRNEDHEDNLVLSRHEVCTLIDEVNRLCAALEECANDLEASVNAEYAGTLDYPSQRQKWKRDMEPVIKARKALKDKP